MKTIKQKERIENINKSMIRYIYMIRAILLNGKSKYYGLKDILYIGQTNDISRRFKEHLLGINSSFLRANFKDSRKILVYVETIFGTEYDSMQRELKLKNMTRKQKESIIKGSSNQLVTYNYLKKTIVIKKHDNPEEQEAFKII